MDMKFVFNSFVLIPEILIVETIVQDNIILLIRTNDWENVSSISHTQTVYS